MNGPGSAVVPADAEGQMAACLSCRDSRGASTGKIVHASRAPRPTCQEPLDLCPRLGAAEEWAPTRSPAARGGRHPSGCRASLLWPGCLVHPHSALAPGPRCTWAPRTPFPPCSLLEGSSGWESVPSGALHFCAAVSKLLRKLISALFEQGIFIKTTKGVIC